MTMSHKKVYSYNDQTNSSRIERLKTQTLEEVKKSFRPLEDAKVTKKINKGYDDESHKEALTRVRAGGYMVKPNTAKTCLANKLLNPDLNNHSKYIT